MEITPVPFEKRSEQRKGESSAEIRERVVKAKPSATEIWTEKDRERTETATATE